MILILTSAVFYFQSQLCSLWIIVPAIILLVTSLVNTALKNVFITVWKREAVIQLPFSPMVAEVTLVIVHLCCPL